MQVSLKELQFLETNSQVKTWLSWCQRTQKKLAFVRLPLTFEEKEKMYMYKYYSVK